MAFNLTKTQMIKIKVDKKPSNVKKDGIVLEEQETLNDLNNNLGWYFDSINNIIYVRFAPN